MTGVADRRVSTRLAALRSGCRFVVATALFGAGALAYRAVSGHSGQPPLAGVVVATACVAVVLWLVHDPVDRLSARVLLGDRADGYQVVRALTERLAGTLPVDEVVPRVAEAASRTTGQPRAEVRLWLTGGQAWTQAWPATAPPIVSSSAAEAGTTVDVRHGGATVGQIAVDGDASSSPEGLSRHTRRLLDDLARPAGLALSTVRLTVELRQRKADLEQLTGALRASRQRLLSARLVEQRRMRAEVAARVSPHIVEAMAALDGPPDADVTTEELDRVASRATTALDALRSVARGIFPPTLADAGLAASLRGWLLRTDVDAVVVGPAELPTLRSHPDLEACLYFCGVTALAWLASHGATGMQVTVTDDPEPALHIDAAVPGGAAPVPLGSDALMVVTDRVEAFDGTVRDVSTSGRFSLIARVPLPSATP